MTAAPLTIVCANCGAKYKLPADFKAASAKCKGCGASIDVAGQVRAAASPAAKATAKASSAPSAGPTAKPATRSGARATTAGADSARGRSRAAGRRERGGEDSSTRGGRRRGQTSGDATAKSGGNKVVLIGSMVVVVGLAVVGYFVFFDKKAPEPAPLQTAGAPSQDKVAADAAMSKSDAVDSAKAEADAAAKELAAQASGAGDKKDEASDGKSDAAKDHGKDAPPAKADAKLDEKAPIAAADVFDPRTLEPLQYPDYVDAAQRKEIESLCADVRNGGIAGRRAKTRLEEIGHPAIVGVVNAYQKIDFKDPDQAMYAFELNKLLTNAFGAGVISANYKPTQAGEPIPPETADWNAKTVNAWRRFWEKNTDKDAWEKLIKNRKEGKKPGTEPEPDAGK